MPRAQRSAAGGGAFLIRAWRPILGRPGPGSSPGANCSGAQATSCASGAASGAVVPAIQGELAGGARPILCHRLAGVAGHVGRALASVGMLEGVCRHRPRELAMRAGAMRTVWGEVCHNGEHALPRPAPPVPTRVRQVIRTQRPAPHRRAPAPCVRSAAGTCSPPPAALRSSEPSTGTGEGSLDPGPGFSQAFPALTCVQREANGWM